MVIATDTANTAGNKVRVARVLALHKNAVSAEDGRRAVALGDFPSVEINLRKDPKAANDASNRIPIHLDQIFRFAGHLG